MLEKSLDLPQAMVRQMNTTFVALDKTDLHAKPCICAHANVTFDDFKNAVERFYGSYISLFFLNELTQFIHSNFFFKNVERREKMNRIRNSIKRNKSVEKRINFLCMRSSECNDLQNAGIPR